MADMDSKRIIYYPDKSFIIRINPYNKLSGFIWISVISLLLFELNRIRIEYLFGAALICTVYINECGVYEKFTPVHHWVLMISYKKS